MGSLDDRVCELAAMVQEQERRIAELESELRVAQGGEEPRHSRRRMLKTVGAGIAGLAGLSAIRPAESRAANGDSVQIGNSATTGAQTGTARTQLNFTIDNETALVVNAAPSNPSSGARAFWGTGSNVSAVRGDSNATGVLGVATADNGVGVWGFNDQLGYGLVGEAPTGIDVFAFGSGRIVQVQRSAGGGHNYSPDIVNIGHELLREDDGSMWISRQSGAGQAAWKRMNTLRFDASNGSGALFAPTRVIDTRPDATPGGPIGGVTGPLQPGTTYTFGPYASIPSQSVGIVGNLVAVSGSGFSFPAQGYMSIFPGGTPWPGTANINFGGAVYAWANAVTVALGVGSAAGKISIIVGGGGPEGTHAILDIFSYIE